LIYVYRGELIVDASGKLLKAGQLGQLIDGNIINASTQTQAAEFLVLAALPLQEPVVQSGPFVMNSIEEIDQAFRDYHNNVLTL
jgi:redox-sensitive bicupin YhaK (pirin superfamily)